VATGHRPRWSSLGGDVVQDGPVMVLHLSPHPDDEVLGAGATLTLLRDAGCRVVNLACGLGRPDQWDRRRRELEVAIERLGIELRVCEPPLAISSGDDLGAAEGRLVEELRRLHDELGIDLVVAPHERDGHHGHEVVGRAAARWLVEDEVPVRWWAWGLWADLPAPTLLVPFDADRLAAVAHALAAHEGEVERNDYVGLLEARAVTGAVLGSEKVLGFGAPRASELPFAELFVERAVVAGEGLLACTPRVWHGGSGAVLTGAP
jgi:LmbE family N-acetylglucosaminyl deacetylase